MPPSVIGGVGITWRREVREAYVEFYNDGTIHALLSDDATRQMEDAALAADADSMDSFITRAHKAT